MINLKIAIQKSGRLNEDSLTLLKECGISINNGKDQLMAQASNFRLDVLYLRNSDIPQYVRDGVADIAIIGALPLRLPSIYRLLPKTHFHSQPNEQTPIRFRVKA